MSMVHLSLPQALSIACANTIIKHMGLGLFISDYHTISEGVLRQGIFRGHTYVTLGGQTNTGKLINISHTIIFKKEGDEQRSVERVRVSVLVGVRDQQHVVGSPVTFDCILTDQEFVLLQIP